MELFVIHLSSLIPDQPLPVDLFLKVAGRDVVFKRRGENLSGHRIEALSRHGITKFWVPEEHRPYYLLFLREQTFTRVTPDVEWGHFIKQTTLLHVRELFLRPDISPGIELAKDLVSSMVDRVTSDLPTTQRLMALVNHDFYTFNHSVNVAIYAIAFARRVFGDNKETLIQAGLGGLLHDLGKRNLGWNVINKPGPLTKQEWAEVKRHPEYGRNALQGVQVGEEVLRVVYEHHENFDGKGYPDGRHGEEISLLARIVAIADVFDALTTDRSYHQALDAEGAMEKMFRMQPGKFDPKVFQSFVTNFSSRAPFVLPEGFDPCLPGALKKAAGGSK